MDALQQLNQQIISCTQCPRLVEYRQAIAREKRRMYSDWVYWGRPVPGFGDESARVLILGLAPAAHGANRTGRMFTGDGSSEWLLRSLYKYDFSNQPSSVHKDDGLALKDIYITAALRCAPPANKPLAEELARCQPYLLAEFEALSNVQVIIALGKIAFDSFLNAWKLLKHQLPSPKPKFGHGLQYELPPNIALVASYHPSRQNTQTGKLTQAMLDSIFEHARQILSS